MEMQGTVHRVCLSDAPTCEEVLVSCDLRPDMVIVVVNGKPVPYTAPLKADDLVKIIRVASGG